MRIPLKVILSSSGTNFAISNSTFCYLSYRDFVHEIHSADREEKKEIPCAKINQSDKS